MSDKNSMHDLMTVLLGNELLGQNLSDGDKAAVRDLVQAFTSDLQIGCGKAADSVHVSKAEFAELEEMLTGLNDGVSQADLNQEWLCQQDTITLLQAVSEHLEAVHPFIAELSTRMIGSPSFHALTQVEQRWRSLTVSIRTLQKTLERSNSHRQISQGWQQRLKTCLL